jgi:hypothetical protein
MNQITEAFLDCLDRAQAETEPFRYWLLEDVLTEEACDGILELPIEPPKLTLYDGTRECNNESRTYFNPELCAREPVCRQVVEAFKDQHVIDKLERTCGIDLSQGNLRIEYTQDSDGFWLEPHTDIGVKMFTMLVYFSKEPELADAGTDIYDQDKRHVGRAPFAPNRGLIFIPGGDTWHGFARRPLRGVRRSIIVNYVSDEWRAREQLA